MLKASERLGSVVTDDAVAVVWSADDGQVVSATPTLCDLVGWRQGELVGRPAVELGLQVDASDRGAVDDTEPWRVTSVQVELHTRSNATLPVEARSHVMRVRGERLVFTVVDPAPQEQGLLELVLDGVPLGIVVLDRQLRVVRVNTRATAMSHASESESVGRRFRDALPAIADSLEDDLADILAGGAPRRAVELSLPTGRFLASYFPLMAPNGAVNGVGCIFVDITEQRNAEDALHESEEHRRVILGEILRAEEAERSRIALDLHDDTIQVLAAALFKTDSVVALARRHNQADIASRLTQARDVLAAATERARRLMFELHPTLLDQRGLDAALTALAEETGHQIGATWSVDVPDTRYSWAVETLTLSDRSRSSYQHSQTLTRVAFQHPALRARPQTPRRCPRQRPRLRRPTSQPRTRTPPPPRPASVRRADTPRRRRTPRDIQPNPRDHRNHRVILAPTRSQRSPLGAEGRRGPDRSAGGRVCDVFDALTPQSGLPTTVPAHPDDQAAPRRAPATGSTRSRPCAPSRAATHPPANPQVADEHQADEGDVISPGSASGWRWRRRPG
jgi:PAS domain-containing protein